MPDPAVVHDVLGQQVVVAWHERQGVHGQGRLDPAHRRQPVQDAGRAGQRVLVDQGQIVVEELPDHRGVPHRRRVGVQVAGGRGRSAGCSPGRARSGVSSVLPSMYSRMIDGISGSAWSYPRADARLPRGNRVGDQVVDRDHQPEVVHLLGEELDHVPVAGLRGDRVGDVRQAAEQLTPLQLVAAQDLGRRPRPGSIWLANRWSAGWSASPVVLARSGLGMVLVDGQRVVVDPLVPEGVEDHCRSAAGTADDQPGHRHVLEEVSRRWCRRSGCRSGWWPDAARAGPARSGRCRSRPRC